MGQSVVQCFYTAIWFGLVIGKHVTRTGIQNQSRKVPEFFASNNDLSVIRAETLFTEFVVEHNIPIACTDHAGKLFQKMFPDSSIVKKYGCARTKTTNIIQTLANTDAASLISKMLIGPFSIATDGSNDNESTKL